MAQAIRSVKGYGKEFRDKLINAGLCSAATAAAIMTSGIVRSASTTSLCRSGSCPDTQPSKFYATRDFPRFL